MTKHGKDKDKEEKAPGKVVKAEESERKEPAPADKGAGGGPDNGAEEGVALAAIKGANTHLRKLINTNYLEYASYVIKDRAIPDVNDGLKPVQRRILWSLHEADDGRFHKVANIIGHTMKYHPHGDASIYEALVVLANKEYFIDRQGNFGNIYTGDPASAARYIECRLTPLAKEVLFNDDITQFVDSYDGRNREPVFFPCKIPALLMLGCDGIAPGMTTKILPHNFKELLEAQISYLKDEKFKLYPDFLQGGLMDVSEYDDGKGRITLRAKIEIQGRKLIVREIPDTTTTESLIKSIEEAANKNKIKIASINDFTTEKVEIEITPQRGYEPEKALKALYAYTDCSVCITSNILVIKDNRPVMMTVSEILRHNTDCLVEYLRAELQLELGKLQEKFHEKTLEQIFIENRIYKRIEKCKTYDLVLKEVRDGLDPFKHMLKREITDKDIEKLLAIPIRRISLFDINKNKEDLDKIALDIEQVEKNLKRIKSYTIKYISSLLEKFAGKYPRRTEIETFEKFDKKEIALNNIKVGWDRKNCLIGTSVKSDDTVTCNEFDRLLCIERNCTYKVIAIPDKVFVGRLFYFCKYDKATVFNVVYRDKENNLCYAKRTLITKFITDKEYQIAPPGAKLEIINTRENYIYECVFEPKAHQKQKSVTLDFSKIPFRSPKSKGFKISTKNIIDFKFLGTAEELQGTPLPPAVEGQPADAPHPGELPLDAEDEDAKEPADNKEEKKAHAAKHEPAELKKEKLPTKDEKKEAPPKTEKEERTAKEEDRREKEERPVPKKLRQEPASAKKADDSNDRIRKGKKPSRSPKDDSEQLELDIVKEEPPRKNEDKASKDKKSSSAKSGKTAKPAADLRDKKSKDKAKGGKGEDDWGISQPEFGF